MRYRRKCAPSPSPNRAQKFRINQFRRLVSNLTQDERDSSQRKSRGPLVCPGVKAHP